MEQAESDFRQAEACPLMGSQAEDDQGGDESDLGVGPEQQEAASRALFSLAPGFLIGAFVVAFDISFSMANYSRRIASDLHQLENAVWIPLAGSVSDAACQPLYGHFSKVYGRARPAIAAAMILAAGLLLSGISQVLWQLACARVLCGMGSSGVLLVAIVVLTDLTTLSALPLFRSVLVIFQNCGFMFGSPLGSAIASATSWHIPFIIESTFAAIAAGALFLGFSYSNNTSKRVKSSPIPISQRDRHSFDILGSTTLLVAVLTPLIALNLGGNALPWGHPIIIAMLSMTPLLFAGFAYLELFVVEFPLLPMHLFKSPPILKVLLCTGLIVFARNELDIHITLYTEIRSTPESSVSNWIVTWYFFGISLGTVCSGWIISRYRRYKWPLVGAATLSLVLYVNMATGFTKPEQPRYAIALICFGIVLGAAHNCLIVGLMSRTQRRDRAMSYALFELVVAISADTGIAVSSALQRQWTTDSMHTAFGSSPEAKEIIKQSLKSLDYVRSLPVEIQKRVLMCFAAALRKVFGVSCIMLGLSVLVALSLEDSLCDRWKDDIKGGNILEG